MDLAIVTGAAGRLGQSLCRKLLELGFRVYGWDHDFSKCVLHDRDFVRVPCDLSSPDTVQSAWKLIESEPGTLMVVVHANALPETGSYETLAPESLVYFLQTALQTPLLLTRLALPHLIRFRGHLITVGWNSRGHPSRGALEAAVQGGLYHFGQELFRELRDTGVKVTHLYPEQPVEVDPEAAKSATPQSLVDPALVAEALGQILQFKENNIIGELVIRPRGTRENPKLANTVVQLIRGPREVRLPSRENFPVEPEPIPTPKRERPADAPPPEAYDADDEDEDDELDRMIEQSRQFLKSQMRPQHHKPPTPQPQNQPAARQPNEEKPEEKGGENASQQQSPGGRDQERRHRRRRRRRRGGRGGWDGQQPRPQGASQSGEESGRSASHEFRAPSRQEDAPRPETAGETPPPHVQAQPERKPETVALREEAPPRAEGRERKSEEVSPGNEPAKKTPKKAAKKAVKKAAKKAVRKAAKKATKKQTEE